MPELSDPDKSKARLRLAKTAAVRIFWAVFRLITEALDRWAIRSACHSVRNGEIEPGLVDKAQAMLAHQDFFQSDASAPEDLAFHGANEFRFRSRVITPWAENNMVYGKLFSAGKNSNVKPSVLLVHGWNGELGYYFQFPLIARLLNRAGMNVAMIELPYHARRRPQGAGAINNFISHDLVRMLEATQQAVADLRAVLGWLRSQGSPVTGLWGISLGAWITGLLAAIDREVHFAVLMSPIVSLDHAIRDLPFCAPIRESLGNRPFNVDKLNLTNHIPHCAPENVLILESVQDLFAPPETIEEVWKAWRDPDIWRLAHGHISILTSVPMMYRVSRWLARKTASLLVIDTRPATR
jgi:pimeloyl-ACP methyl ester carboxylesterase